jgi:hypothetical protein
VKTPVWSLSGTYLFIEIADVIRELLFLALEFLFHSHSRDHQEPAPNKRPTNVKAAVKLDTHFADALVEIHITIHMINLINRELKDSSFAILGRCLLTCHAQCSL